MRAAGKMSILTRVVEDLLGKYLSDVQDVKIVDIANGHLSLSNLEIRSSALMSLGLPVEVQAGLVDCVLHAAMDEPAKDEL